MEIKSYEKTKTSTYTGHPSLEDKNQQEKRQFTELFTGSTQEQKHGLPYGLEGSAINAIRKDGTLWIVSAVENQPSRSFGAYRLQATPWLDFKSWKESAGAIHGQAIGGLKLFQTWGTSISEAAWDCFNTLADQNSSSEASTVIMELLTAINSFYNAGRLVADNNALSTQLLNKENYFESSQFAGVVYAQPIDTLAPFEVKDGAVNETLKASGWAAYDLDEAQEWVIRQAHLDTALWHERKRYERWLRFLEGNGQRVRPYRGIDQRGNRAPVKAIGK